TSTAGGHQDRRAGGGALAAGAGRPALTPGRPRWNLRRPAPASGCSAPALTTTRAGRPGRGAPGRAATRSRNICTAQRPANARGPLCWSAYSDVASASFFEPLGARELELRVRREIGRASCRERRWVGEYAGRLRNDR